MSENLAKSLNEQFAYWKNQLAGAPALLELPTDRPRPAQHTFDGRLLSFVLNEQLAQEIDSLCLQQNVSPFMVFYAGFAVLLSRYSRQDDLIIGTPKPGQSEFLALRVDLSGSPTFDQLLQQIKQTLLDAYAHQDLPFEKLITALQPEQSLSYLPVFQVGFILQNKSQRGQKMPRAGSSSIELDLTLNITEAESGLVGSFEYNANLFNGSTIQRMIGHLQIILTAAVSNPGQKLSSLPMLTNAEAQQILIEWNETDIQYSENWSLQQFFEKQAPKTPDAVAVMFEDQKLTYAELNTQANQLAHYLKKMGVGPDIPVAICMERSLKMAVGILGILKAGGCYISLDPAYPQERLAYMLQDSALASLQTTPVLLTQRTLAQVLPAHQHHVIYLDADWHTIAAMPSKNLPVTVSQENLVYLLYTSGSTGKPKGVAMKHGALVNLMYWQAGHTSLTKPAKALQFASLGFDVACQEIFFTWSQGGTLVLISEDTRRDAYAMLKMLADTSVEQIFLPFVALQNLAQAGVDHGIPSNTSLREIITAGEQLQATASIKQFLNAMPGCTLDNQYGPTETHVVTAFTLQGHSDEWSALPPIGRPIANAQIYLLDPHLQPVPIGVAGELYIAGDCLARGYLNRPDLTAEKFIPKPFGSQPGARMYRTGDLARWLPDGSIEYLGRIDNQVKIRGFRIELGEIESALRQHPDVQEGAVLAREDAPGIKRLVAYVVSQNGKTLELGELRQNLKEKLPEYMLPSAFVVLDALPLTRNGKVDRKALPAPDNNLTTDLPASPRTLTEKALSNIWTDVLKFQNPGIHSSFFDLGGHSLLATQIISRMRDTFQVELSVRNIFEAPTIAELAESIDSVRHTEAGHKASRIGQIIRGETIPLSFAQQRLWFIDQFENDSTPYNIPSALQLQGVLKHSALEKAFNEIIRRHEILRTIFVTVQDEPTQLILPSLSVSILVTDLSALSDAERAAAVKQLATRDAAQPFDLAQGPLLRASLLKLSETSHILLLNMHHIISDGWSIDIINNELSNLYSAFVNGSNPALPQLPIQYADFAIWQRQWLQGEVLGQQLTYWKQQLANAPALLELPTDHPRPAKQTFHGRTLSFEINAQSTQALKALSRKSNATLFMTLYAAFSVLLSRYSRQQDIVIGSPVANRNRHEIENLIGFFVNTLPLRADLSSNPTFSALLQQVQHTTLDAYAHQDIPFEKLVEELHPQRSLSYSPIFQVLFVMQTTSGDPLQMPGLEISPLVFESTVAKFDLTLDITETESGLTGFFEYNTDLFEVSTIRRMIGHWQTLLDAIIADPEQRGTSLPILTWPEHQQLQAWNDTHKTYPQDKYIHQLFEQQVEKTPDAVALIFEDQPLTYRELNNRANQLAHHLQTIGVGSDLLVAVCIERSLEMVIGLYAILKAGGAYIPIDPTYPPERIAYMLQDSHPGVILTASRQTQFIQQPAILLNLDDWSQFAGLPVSNPTPPLLPDNLAYMIYTSGSTGKPKGALNTHAAILNRLLWMQSAFPLMADDHILQKTPFSFDVSVWEFFWPLMFGARLVVARPDGHKDPQYLARLIQKHNITTLHFVPSMLAAFLETGSIADCTSLRHVICSGEALPLDLAHRFFEQSRAAELHNLYGPTEAAVDVSWWHCPPDAHERVPIGHAIHNTQLHILDANFKPVPVGVAGELFIAGVGLARGYLNRPELTAEKFIPNPFLPAQRMYRTGDLARRLPDGSIEYLGRIDQQVKMRGFRIELGEIEAVLNQHPDVLESAVLAREDIPGDKRLVAYIVGTASADALRAHLKGKLPEYMMPASFVPLHALPLSPNGKLDRKALPAPERSIAAASYAAPRNPTEEVLANIWAEVLHLEKNGIHDNFFELGGHSLLATQVISRIRHVFHVELPVRAIFEAPSIAELAQSVHNATESGTKLIQPASREHPIALSFAQQRLWFLDQFETGSATYNIPAGLHLRGALDDHALENALAQIIHRHEILRTIFIHINDEPVQQILPNLSFRIPTDDISDISGGQQTDQIREWTAQNTRQPFDLSHGPLLRANLLKLADDEHILLLMLHHIVSDGWSMGLLINELADLYTAQVSNQPISMPNLRIQYADFSVWQREWLQGDVLAKQLSYWKQQLADAPALLELPTDHPRPAKQTFNGHTLPFRLDISLMNELKRLSRKNNVTLFMTLYAAFAVLLSRYSRQNDLVIGSPVANRNRHELEPLIGFFVNTLTLRANLSGNPSFSELLHQVRHTTLDAYAHQDVPFEKLVEELHPERSLSYSPIFQVMFALQNTPESKIKMPGLDVAPLAFENTTAKFDLTLDMEESENGLTGVIEYNTDLFDRQTIQRMIGHWETLLNAIVLNPQQKITALPLLTPSERQQIMDEWNATRADFPQSKCIHQLFEEQAQASPDQLAVVFTSTSPESVSQSLTYGALNQRANKLAAYLQKLGVVPDMLVGICVERSLEMLVGVLGILKAGGTYVPLDPDYPKERLAYILSDAQVSVLVTQSHLLANLPDTPARPVCLDTDWGSIVAAGATYRAPALHPEHLAYTIYTSGSTGKPKGVQIPHRAVVNFLNSMRHAPGMKSEDVLLAVTTLSFDIAGLELFLPLSVGAKIEIVPRDVAQDAVQLREKLAASCVTMMQATPVTWKMLLESGWQAQAPLKILCGGEAMPQALADQLAQHGAELWNLYGPTETTIWSAQKHLQPKEWVNIGQPIDNTQLYLLDQSFRLVPAGVPGELYIGGSGLARGYANRPDLTADRFIPNPFNQKPDGDTRLYRTGDLARWLPDGSIEYLGRLDQQVKVRGFRIELGEIEAVLRQHPDTAEGVVLAREDSPGEKRLVAYLVRSNDQKTNDLTSIRQHMKSRLPEYMLPAVFITLDALPLTPNGKLDRKALPQPDASAAVSHYVAPRTPAEEILSAIWGDILKLNRVGVHDNFFDLGGHSLLATQVISRMRNVFHVDLLVRSLFEAPTIAELTVSIENARNNAGRDQTESIQIMHRGASIPLSFSQQRLWFLDQLENESDTYNIPSALQLQGVLNHSALEKAFNEIIRRHEILRTIFVTVQDEPTQLILPSLSVSILVTDLSALSNAERAAAVKQLATRDAAQPFDLSQGPLLRASLLKLSETSHILLLNMHHIISDGWSIDIINNELSNLYSAFVNGSNPALPQLPIQYADFSIWQRQWLQGEVLGQQLTYWKQQLANAPALLELPTDHPRPAKQTFHGRTLSFEINVQSTQALKAISRKNNATLFMTLYSAFAVLLARYSRQQDIVIGSPVANRNRHEIENLIGFFVNTLPLRADLSSNPTFSALLQQVQHTTLDAYAHQDIPFEKLVEELHPQRSLSYSPIFQVLFVMQTTTGDALQMPGLEISPLVFESSVAKFDLTLDITETESGLTGFFEYNTDLFEMSTIRRMIGHWQTLLDAIIADPEQRVTSLLMLTWPEHQQLQTWNDTHKIYPQNKYIHQLFEQQVEKTPETVALIFEDQSLSYRELNNRANQLAHHLQTIGVGPDLLVAVCIERSLEMVIGLYAILKAGGAYIPIDPTYPPERIAYMLQDSHPGVILTGSRQTQFIQQPAILLNLDDWSQFAGLPVSNPTPPLLPDNLAYMIYTSGSTGKPKGALNTHAAILNRLLWMQSAFPLMADDHILQKTPFSFDVSVWEFFWPLMFGARLVVARPDGHKDPQYLAQLIQQHNITTLHFVPSMLAAFLETGSIADCTSLRRVICSGEALPLDLAHRFFEQSRAAELHNLYGPTEAAVDVSWWHCPPDAHERVPIGHAIDNIQLHILDANFKPVPAGVAGELFIAGVGLARGYLNRPELTAEKFIPNPFLPAQRMYRTGDLARRLSDGSIEYLGRIDQQVKMRGFRIELGEIEAVLNQHPDVLESAVLAREDIPGDKRLVAYIVGTASADALRAHLKGKLPEYMLPASFVPLHALPLSPNGKLDRKALPAPERSIAAASYAAPRNPTEEVLANIWAEVLHLEKTGIHDNFFELGGHSLLATQVISRIRHVFQVELPVRAIFEAPSIAELATVLGSTVNASTSHQPALQAAARNGNIPLAYAQESLWFLDQFQSDSAAYNIPLALHLQGTLNYSAIHSTLAEIVQRHEALRTIFVSQHGVPVQQILTGWVLNIPITDLSTLSVEQQPDEIKRLARHDTQQPFDLAHGPLLRASLLKLGHEEHILLLSMHHIISDGWSMGVFNHEFSSLYTAFATGQPPALPNLSIQYADFAVWQREWLQGDVLEQQLSYWKKQLTGAPALLELPADRPRPAKQTFHGHSLSFTVDAAQTKQLNALSRQQNATLFMLLYTAFATLLSRYSRQQDIVIGAAVANRSRPELEPLIGFFVNTLALRADLSGNPTFTQLLKRLQHTTLDAYAHQDVPFEKLVEHLQPERSLSYSPIFQVMFALQNAPENRLKTPGLEISSVSFENSSAKFDLTLEMYETESGLSGSFEYNTDLFDQATIQRMIGHWLNMLKAIVNDPQQRIAQLPLLTDAERQQLLMEWNNTHAAPAQGKCIHQLFEEQAQGRPDQLAVVVNPRHPETANQSLTYHQLNQRANQLAHLLQKRGVGPDVLVAICMDRSLEMIVGLLGILKAGGTYVPIDPDYPHERIDFILQDIQSKVLITQRHILNQLSDHAASAICLDQTWDELSLESTENPHVPLSTDNLVYAIYTSGSTGQPKGVQITHQMLRNLIEWHQDAFDLTAADQTTQVAGAAFDASAWEIWPCLASGATLHIATDETRLSPTALRDWLIAQKITISFLPTPLAEAVLELDWPAQTPLRKLLTGGDKLHAHPAKPLPFALINNYGPTENTVVSTSMVVSTQTESSLAPSIGCPIRNTQIYLLDEHLQFVPTGVAGELYVTGAGLARGYLNRPALTAEKFMPNPFSTEPGARMYRTGDLARWGADGSIEFLGRIDDQVKIRGFRIELGEIESTLSLHPDIQACAVLARQDTAGGAGKRLVAYVVQGKAKKPNADELRTHLKDKLPQYMIPSAFVFLDALPVTPNGKVDRKALSAPEQNEKMLYAPPRSELERKIAAVWQKTLGVEQIGLDDNFFFAGGDSLKVVQIVHHLDYACSVMDLFEHQTVRELAEHIAAQNQHKDVQPAHLLYELTPRSSSRKRQLSLVCIPPAGGNAIVYKDLADCMPGDYTLYALEMPGHDIHRPNEKLLGWPELAVRCVDEIKKTISGPIALYGHSAGASLALEIARLLEQENLPLTRVYLGANFPNMRLSGGLFEYLNIDRMVSDRVYEDAQRQVVGSLFDDFDPQAKAVRTRSWRHDGLENVDYYTFAPKRWHGQKLKAPIISIVGEKDRGTEFYAEQVNDWRIFSESVSLHVIPHAGHYFMKHQAAELAKILVEPDQGSAPEQRSEKRSASLTQFMVVAIGQFISTIGTIMSSYALGAWIYKATGSVTNLGGVAFFEVLPLLLFLPIAGAIADRWDRRKIMLLCDATAALNTVLLATFLFSGILQLWHLWIFSTIYAITSAFQQPAYLAGVAQLVPKRYLAQANGFVQLGQAVGNVIAPLLGGFLIETINLQGVVTLDLITYLFSFGCLVVTRFPNALFKKEEEAISKAILGGWRYLLRRRGLLSLALYFAGNNIGNSILSVMLIPYILSFATGSLLGWGLGAWGLGMATGSLFMIFWGGLRRRVYGIISAFILMNAFTVLVGLSTSPILLCLGVFGNGFCFSLAAGHFYPLLQVKIGDELLGRILATFRMISYSTIPLAYLVAGPLADHVFGPLMQPGGLALNLLGATLGSGPGRGMGLMLATIGLLIMLWGVLAFLYRPLREMETDLPDALINAVIHDDKDILQRESDQLLVSPAEKAVNNP